MFSYRSFIIWGLKSISLTHFEKYFYWFLSPFAKKYLDLENTEFYIHHFKILSLLSITTFWAKSYFYSPFAKEEISVGRFSHFLNVPPEEVEPGWAAVSPRPGLWKQGCGLLFSRWPATVHFCSGYCIQAFFFPSPL